MSDLKLYTRYISILIRGQLQYRASTISLFFGQMLHTFIYYLSAIFMFGFFGQLQGWTFWEVMLCTAAVHIAYPLAECLARGFDSFRQLIRNGSFDTLLLRPRNIFLQVFGSRFELSRAGRLAQGLIMTALAAANCRIDWTAGKVGLYLLMILSGTVIFMGVFILGATLCFWTVKGLEVVNIFTDGGRELSQYPYEIYKKPYLIFFTCLVPYASAFYWPLLYLTGRSASPWCWAAPVFAMLFIVPACLIFRLGVRHYTSTGS